MKDIQKTLMYRDRNQRDFARNLRNNATEAERKLWGVLRAKQVAGLKFRRQVAIGKYIVDFACMPKKVVIELDGGQHNEETAMQYDAERTVWLRSQGYQVLRYWNNEVMKDTDSVVDAIVIALETQT